MREKEHNKIFYILMLIIVAVVCLGSFFGYFIYRAKTDPFERIQMSIEGDWPIEGDAEVGFVAVKNGSTTRVELDKDIRYEIFTDNRGARVNAKGLQTSDQVYLLTLGGSFSWGHGLENKYTFTERVGKKMDIPVANFAMGSYGTVQSLQMLKRNMELKPKVVVYAFINDHIRRNLAPCASSYAPYCLPVSYVDFTGDGKPFIHSPRMELFSPELNRRFFKEVMMKDPGIGLADILWRMRIDLFKIKTTKSIGRRTDDISRKASMNYLIDEMNSIAKEGNTKLVVVYIPMLERDITEPPPAELTDALTKDIIFIDMAPLVSEHYANKENPLLRFKNDGHPNKMAHEMFAEEVERVLRSANIR